MSKFRQVANLARAGIPVPLSAQLEFGAALDRNHWGPFVVLKPTTPGFMSHGSAFLMRTEKVVDLAESIFPAGHPIRRAPVMVQKFVDTGEWPSYYRVLTLFGQPLYCVRGVTAEPRPPLAASDEALVKATIATNAANGSKYNTAYDTDVLELARRTYDAFPAIPLQAVDIVRDQATGGLFVLEINAGGNTWHFSSQHIASLPNTVPRVQKIAQFGAWDVAARILCKKTLERAR
jgi:glutathione synthase/RimK-type ligase-like ATP-grasp enzyme